MSQYAIITLAQRISNSIPRRTFSSKIGSYSKLFELSRGSQFEDHQIMVSQFKDLQISCVQRRGISSSHHRSSWAKPPRIVVLGSEKQLPSQIISRKDGLSVHQKLESNFQRKLTVRQQDFKKQINNCSKTRNCVTFDALLTEMDENSELRHPSIIQEILNCCSSMGVRGKQFALATNLLNWMRTDHVINDRNLQMALSTIDSMESPKVKQWDLAWQIFQQGLAQGIQPNVDLFKLLIRIANKAKLPEKVDDIFSEMKRLGVQADSDHYYGAMLCWGNKAGNIPRAFRFWDKMVKEGNCKISIKLVQLALKYSLKSKDMKKARMIFRKYLKFRHYTLEEFVVNSYLQVCSAVGNKSEALKTLDLVRRRNKSPSIHNYGIAINVCANSNPPDSSLAEYLLAKMKVDGVAPNLVIYNTFMKTCMKDHKTAINTIKLMQKESIEPDRICYNSAINSCAEAGAVQQAESLLAQMEANNIKPDHITHNTMLKVYARSGVMEEGVLRYMGAMFANGSHPDFQGYSIAIKACSLNGFDIYAKKLFRRMNSQRTRFSPTNALYSSLVFAALDTNNFQYVIPYYLEMKEQKIRMNHGSYNTFLHACVEFGDFDYFFEILHDMQSQGLKPDRKTCLLLLRAFSQCS